MAIGIGRVVLSYSDVLLTTKTTRRLSSLASPSDTPASEHQQAERSWPFTFPVLTSIGMYRQSKLSESPLPPSFDKVKARGPLSEGLATLDYAMLVKITPRGFMQDALL